MPITNVRRSKISSLKDSVIKELNSHIFKLDAIIQVLGRERNGGVVKKLELSDEFCHLSGEFCDELNHDFLELFQSAISNSVGRPLEADTEKYFDKGCLPEVLELVNVFDKEGIDKNRYNVTFRIAENVTKQGCVR
nr:phospholipase-like protein [Tanacetum cinerariifolium]